MLRELNLNEMEKVSGGHGDSEGEHNSDTRRIELLREAVTGNEYTCHQVNENLIECYVTTESEIGEDIGSV